MTLSVENLSCARGGRAVFQGVAFTAPPGAIVVLRGPNGSGKSTLLRALAGLVSAEGEIRWENASLAADRDTFQAHVAYVGHLDAVKPALSVRENLSFWAALLSEEPEQDAIVDAALEEFRLTALADAPAAFCSAGQRRRLGLARLALTGRPVWLLDEPTVSLDAESVAEFAALVAAHCARGGVALAATHLELGLPGVKVLQMEAFAPTRGLPADAFDDPFLDPALDEIDRVDALDSRR